MASHPNNDQQVQLQNVCSNMAYHSLAYVYDQLMSEAPYDQWLKHVQNIMAIYQLQPQVIIDLACGTGTLTQQLTQSGFNVIGIDRSADMLAVAHQKYGSHIEWIEQDMTSLELVKPVDMVLCFCDALNYLTTDDEVRQMFQSVYHQIADDGYFLFDCHSMYKVHQIFANNTFCSSDEELSYIWQCSLDEETNRVTHDLTFFVLGKNGSYQRFDETHEQRAYSHQQLTQWLTEAGFELLSITADFSEATPQDRSERLFFVAKKPTNN
jgi:SAM-dependent methyltransferase